MRPLSSLQNSDRRRAATARSHDGRPDTHAGLAAAAGRRPV